MVRMRSFQSERSPREKARRRGRGSASAAIKSSSASHGKSGRPSPSGERKNRTGLPLTEPVWIGVTVMAPSSPSAGARDPTDTGMGAIVVDGLEIQRVSVGLALVRVARLFCFGVEDHLGHGCEGWIGLYGSGAK